MKRLEIGGWCIESDEQATRIAAQERAEGFPEQCGCAQCCNFIAVRSQAYPPEAIAFLAQLGIEPGREEDVTWVGPSESGLQKYSGWFHFVGRLRGQTDGASISDPGNMTRLGNGFHFFLVAEAPGSKTVRLEFTCEVPWVLPGSPEDELR